MKRPQKILAALAVVLVIAAIVLVQTFNVLAVRNRDQVQQELQKVLGKNVNFNSLEVHWLGQLGFVATEFRIADDPRFAATPLLHARELVLGISLWNLLFRRLVIDKLIFNGAEFQIITDETGALNLTTLLNRKNELRGFSKVPPVPAEPKHSAVSFLISDIRVRDGRIEYVDRSVKAPAELRMKNISMRLKGFARQQATQITFAASLTEGLSQDVRIDGRLEPVPSDPSWLHRPIDLNIRLDSLHVPVVARAIAALRDKIPEELDVTGPMALQAKAGGTAERPRIDSFTLKIPLFGSSDYNAVVDGSIQFTERRLWEDAAIQGKLVVEPLALMRDALTCLLQSVGGIDVVAHPAAAKKVIGVVPQTNTLDRALDVAENLFFHGRYFGMTAREAHTRTAALLEQFRLADRARADVAEKGDVQENWRRNMKKRGSK
jgi:hypothetical protein